MNQTHTPEDREPEEAGTPVPQREKRRASGWLLSLFWLVLLGLGAAAGYYYLQPQVVQYQDDLAGLRTDLVSVASQLADNEERVEGLAEGLGGQQQLLPGLEAELNGLRSEMNALALRLREVESVRSGDWVVAEARYLVRMASQKLLIGGDVESALQLLEQADQLLFALGYPETRAAREALAADVVRLRQVAAVDYQGIHFRLSSLIALVEDLPPPPIPALDLPAASGADTSLTGWRHWLRVVASRLEPFFILRRGDSEPGLSSGEAIALQKLRLQILLHEAQLALMAAEQEIFRDSLERAARVLAEDFADSPAAQTLRSQIEELAEREIRSSLPEILASERALQNLFDTLRSGDAAGSR